MRGATCPSGSTSAAPTSEQIDRELCRAAPGWHHDDLRAFSVDVATRAESIAWPPKIERSPPPAPNWDQPKGWKPTLAKAEADLAALGEASTPRRCWQCWPTNRPISPTSNSTKAKPLELAKVERQLATALRKLTPPLWPAHVHGDRSPTELPVPREETVAEFDAELTDLGQELRLAIDSLRKKIPAAGAAPIQARPGRRRPNPCRSGRARRPPPAARCRLGTDPPPLPRAPAGRRRRNRLDRRHARRRWSTLICGRFARPTKLPTRFTSMPMRRRSARVCNDMSAILRRIAAKQFRLDELKRQEADLSARWLALWQPCGFEPLAPDAMRHWLADQQRCRETVPAGEMN